MHDAIHCVLLHGVTNMLSVKRTSMYKLMQGYACIYVHSDLQ